MSKRATFNCMAHATSKSSRHFDGAKWIKILVLVILAGMPARSADDATTMNMIEKQTQTINQLQAQLAALQASQQSLTQTVHQLSLQLLASDNKTMENKHVYDFIMAHTITVNNGLRNVLQNMPDSRKALQTAFPVRLVNGNSPMEGRVELRIGDTWGTICDDYADDNFAKVVCNQLGYPSAHATQLQQARFGQGTGHILLSELRCTGSENHLLLCPSPALLYGDTDCTHPEDVGVICIA